jgi:hypothetical protein
MINNYVKVVDTGKIVYLKVFDDCIEGEIDRVLSQASLKANHSSKMVLFRLPYRDNHCVSVVIPCSDDDHMQETLPTGQVICSRCKQPCD